MWCKHGKTPLDKICTSTYNRSFVKGDCCYVHRYLDYETQQHGCPNILEYVSENVRTSPPQF